MKPVVFEIVNPKYFQCSFRCDIVPNVEPSLQSKRGFVLRMTMSHLSRLLRVISSLLDWISENVKFRGLHACIARTKGYN